MISALKDPESASGVKTGLDALSMKSQLNERMLMPILATAMSCRLSAVAVLGQDAQATFIGIDRQELNAATQLAYRIRNRNARAKFAAEIVFVCTPTFAFFVSFAVVKFQQAVLGSARLLTTAKHAK